jgi:S1-C subfamily serine protease
LEQWDVLLKIDDYDIRGLKHFSDVLKQLEPGQTVKALVRRGEDLLQFEVTVEER